MTARAVLHYVGLSLLVLDCFGLVVANLTMPDGVHPHEVETARAEL